MAETGAVIDGKYEILKQIGKGGMSKVYLAMDKRLNKQWAVKEIQKRPQDKNNRIVIQSAIAEANMMKMLDHPALPRIVDIIEQEHEIYVIMDYIEGETLSSLVKQGPQPQEIVIDWAKQLCGVLDYLHTRKPPIIYRDMKPGNVMLKPDGTVKLIDFGIAREYKEQNIADTVSLGTKGYAAPEQFGGKGQTDARTDVYCLGVTLHHLLTGHSPTDPPYELYPIRQYRPELSAGLEEIIEKCVQPNPSDRYQSCAELLYALEHYEDGDQLHKRYLKKQLVHFFAVAIACLIFLAVGITAQRLMIATNNADYDRMIDQAEKSGSVDDKLTYYQSAIEIKPDAVPAYKGMVAAFKDDAVFSVKEEELLKQTLNGQLKTVRKNKEYSQLAFETGKLYWYYYDYGISSTNQDNQITRMKSSIQWFEDAISYGNESDSFYEMAKVYCEIGKFNRDITLNVEEASDKGKYKSYWDNLNEMRNMVDQNSESSEIVDLELNRLIMNAIETYARKFKADGITQAEMKTLYQQTLSATKNVSTTTDKTNGMKQQIMERVVSTEQEIDHAFAS